jgi:hypothetical protein
VGRSRGLRLSAKPHTTPLSSCPSGKTGPPCGSPPLPTGSNSLGIESHHGFVPGREAGQDGCKVGLYALPRSQHRSQLSNSIRGVRLYVTAESLRALGFSWGMCWFPLGTLRAPPSGVASGELNTLGGPLRHRPGMGFLTSREGPSRVRGSRFWHNRRQKGGTSLVADLSAADLVPSDRASAARFLLIYS